MLMMTTTMAGVLFLPRKANKRMSISKVHIVKDNQFSFKAGGSREKPHDQF
jgi:hypothetical protein